MSERRGHEGGGGYPGAYKGAERRVSNDIGDWRADVSVSLGEIKAQMLRIASDRESEKGTMRRMEEHFRKEDQRVIEACGRQHDILAQEIKAHAKADADRNDKLGEKVLNIDRRLTLIVGMGTGIQMLIVLAAAAMKLLGSAHG